MYDTTPGRSSQRFNYLLITLKKDVQYPNRIPKEEADNFLKKYRSITLGQAIKLIEKNALYSDTLYSNLKAFLEERNWLVHKFLHHHLDDIYETSTRDRLFHRIKNISNLDIYQEFCPNCKRIVI